MSEHFAMKLLSLIVLVAGVVAAQSTPPRKDIPAIAKAANGAIVSIVMSDKDGKPIAQGSGFLVSKDGVIVTNYHVISEGGSAIVKLPDGAFYVVDGVLAFDKARDVAVIKAHGGNFRTLTLGNSDRLQVGEEVVAIGNPLSLESTVSNGIVSGMRTSKEQGGKFLQTTAPISPGSSGGPLLNMLGEVVGINTMYLEGGENLNFAIPINDAKLLLSNQSAKLQNLPNEQESAPKDAPPSNSGEGLIAQVNSPAYQSYQGLLKSGDAAFMSSTYACFSDDPQYNGFRVISAHLEDKHSMMVIEESFANGISRGGVVFSGPLNEFSGATALFATLPTNMVNSLGLLDGHETDLFEWGPDEISMKTGFGKLSPGIVRTTYVFTMRRSTGRYAEHIFADTEHGITVDKTGRCVRIPNIGRTPEEEYPSLK